MNTLLDRRGVRPPRVCSRRLPALVGALALALAPFAPAQLAPDPRYAPEAAGQGDPSETYLKAFTSVQQAQKLRGDGKLQPALAKYRYAASLLDQLAQTNPNWQPVIVKYRTRLTTEDIRKLQEQIAAEPAAERNVRATTPLTAGGDDSDLPVPDSAPPYSSQPSPRAPEAAETYSPPAPPRETADRSASELRVKLAKSEQQVKALVDALGNAKREKQEILKREQELDYQVQSARTAASLSQKRFEHVKTDRDDTQKELEKAQASLKVSLTKNPSAEDTRKQREQIKSLQKSLAQTQTDMEAANKEREDLSKKLKAGEDRTAQLTKERDAAMARNDLTKDAAEKINALQAENTSLTQKLTAAETSITQLTAEAAKKREELEGMQKELTAARDQLATSRDKADRLETANTDLNQQLAENTDKLAKLKAGGKTDADFERMTKENDLLKDIVVRELRDEARRRQARGLVTEELARLDVQSDLLKQQVEELGRPTVQLTDDERALFKDPQVSVSDLNDPSSLAVRITAVKPRNGPEAAAPDGSAPGASPSPAAGGVPRVETNPPPPPVSQELQAMAKEAKEQFDRKQYVEAERTFGKMLAREPQNPYLLSTQGLVFFKQGKFKNAELVLKKAVALDTSDAHTQATLGIVYYRMGRYDDAINWLTRAITLDPKNATAHNYLGITSSQKGWPEAAIEEVQKAIALNPNYADAHFNIAVIYATNQPPAKDRAQEHYRKATELGAAPDPALEKLLQ